MVPRVTGNRARLKPSLPPSPIVLAIDPGTTKCGLAVVEKRPGSEKVHVLHREVVETERLVARALPLVSAHEVLQVIVGNATNGRLLLKALRAALPPSVPVEPIEEAFTSQRARVRFQLENPPRGWRRLLPPGIRTPSRAYDDYVAVLLAEDYFAARKATEEASGEDAERNA